MNIRKGVAVSLVATAALAAGLAQAHSDVQWSVQIGGPIGVAIASPPYVTYSQPVVPVYAQPVYAQPVYAQPVYVQPGYGYGHGWRDRYDRVYYHPRWDRDGVPNRYDRRDDRRYDGRDDRRDHHHGWR